MQDIYELVQTLNSAERVRQTEAKRFVEEQAIKKALGPEEWRKLKERLAKECESIRNSSPVNVQYHEDGQFAIKITNVRDGRRAFLSYNADVPCVMYITPVDRDHLAFRVSPDGTMLQFMAKGIPVGYDEIAVTLLSQIIG